MAVTAHGHEWASPELLKRLGGWMAVDVVAHYAAHLDDAAQPAGVVVAKKDLPAQPLPARGLVQMAELAAACQCGRSLKLDRKTLQSGLERVQLHLVVPT